MFALAGALDPAGMRALAGEAFAEMAGAGYGAVGEFHYVHHQPDGTPYEDPNEMAHRRGRGGARKRGSRS